MIRSAKDIPAEIKSIVGKFYMNNVEKAQKAIVKLRAEKPEYNGLLDNVEHLFEHAPESVFTFYDELIALDKASEAMNPEIDFSIDSLMDSDEEAANDASESEDAGFKLNLDDECEPGDKKSDNHETQAGRHRDSVEIPAGLNFNFGLPDDLSSEKGSSEKRSVCSSERKPLVDENVDEKISEVRDSEDKQELVKSCFSEVFEGSTDSSGKDSEQTFDISSCLMKEDSSNERSESSDSGIKLVSGVSGNESEEGSKADGLDISIEFDDNDPAFNMPNLFADDDGGDEQEVQSSREEDFSFSHVLDVPSASMSTPIPSSIKSSSDDSTREETVSSGFSVPILTSKEESEEKPTFSLLGDESSKQENSVRAESSESKSESSESKSESSESKSESSEEEIEIPIFGISDFVHKESSESSESSKSVTPLPRSMNLSAQGVDSTTPVPHKIIRRESVETPTPLPKGSERVSSISLSSKFPFKHEEKKIDSSTPIPHKITAEEPATPVPEFMSRNRIPTRNNHSDITPIPEKIERIRKISAFSGESKAGEKKSLTTSKSSTLFGISSGLDEIKAKLGESKLSQLETSKSNDTPTPLPGFQNSKLRQQKITSISLNSIPPATTRPQTPSGIIATDPVARLRPLSRVPRLVCKLSEIPQHQNINPRAGFLLSLIDGRTSISDILDISAWPEEDTANLMLELEAQDIIFFR